jgi:hypothetical protein
MEQTRMNENILHHKWCEKDDDFFKRIDRFGGWPPGMRFVAFHHSEERECKFVSQYLHDGWWTTICDSDEYYYWKLSEKKITEIENNAIEKIIKKLRHLKEG